jgi:hypothetical protein
LRALKIAAGETDEISVWFAAILCVYVISNQQKQKIKGLRKYKNEKDKVIHSSCCGSNGTDIGGMLFEL